MVRTSVLCNLMLLVVYLTSFCNTACGDPDNYFTVPEAKLLESEFSATSWGGTVERTDALGDAALFLFSSLSSSSTGIKDDYPVGTLYGQVLPSHGNGDFSNFDGYILWVENLDAAAVSLSLFINTGFTGPSGNPSNDLRNDTFWQSQWVEVLPGEARMLWLDFDDTIPWNIADNPFPHTQGSDGVATAINDYDRAEISAIGFQIYANANSEAAILVSPADGPVCLVRPEGDLSKDCRVDFEDIAIMASQWLACNVTPASLCE